MLPLSELARVGDTVGPDGRSPIADVVAAAWGHPPGAASFWRSSASHVFVVLDEDRTRRVGFLRFVPAQLVGRREVAAVAALMERLAGAGAATAPLLRSSSGSLVETVDVDGRQVHAMLVAAVDGALVDPDDLTAESAQAWGAALGRLHRDGDGVAAGLDLPEGRDRTDAALAAFAGDAVLGDVVAEVRSRLAALPRQRGSYGIVHGDFELDNLAWVDGAPIAYDFDEAERSWFAADIACAFRDLVPEPRALAADPPASVTAFLTGYRRERPAMSIDLDQLVLFTAVNALRSLARLGPVLAEDPDAGRGILVNAASGQPLRTVVDNYAARLRHIAVDLAPLLR